MEIDNFVYYIIVYKDSVDNGIVDNSIIYNGIVDNIEITFPGEDSILHLQFILLTYLRWLILIIP